MTSIDFSPRTVETQAQILASHLPDGYAWANKSNSDSTIGKLIIGLAFEYFRLSLLIEDAINELDARQTEKLLREWEQSVGIPDDCFKSGEDLETARRLVLLKLTEFSGIQTANDFVRLANTLGFTAIVTNGMENGVFPMTFPIRFFADKKAASHTIFVDLADRREVFALPVPIPFTAGLTGIIECLFRKLAPANCEIIFRYGALL